MDLQSLVVPLLLDTSKYEAGLDKAGKSTNSTMSGMGKVGGAVVAGMAVVGGALSAIGVDAINQTVKWGEKLDSIQDITGMSTSQAAGFGLMVESVGGDISTVNGQLTYMEKNLIGTDGQLGTTGQAFQNMGISIYDSNGNLKDANTLYGESADAISQLPDGIEKTTLLTELFGKSGATAGDLMNAAANGGMKDYEEQANAIGLAQDPQQVIAYGIAQQKLQATVMGLKVAFGQKLMPVITRFAEVMAKVFSDPAIMASIGAIADGVANFAVSVIEKIPSIILGFQNFVTWLQNNQPIILGVLVALAVAVGIWAVQTAIAGWAAMSPFLPIIGILLAIVAVVALLAAAWQSDFAGIRTATTEAFGKIAAFWNGVLKPAFQQIWSFISTYILPIFASIGKILISGVIYHFKVLGALFTNIIVPALKAVYGWLAEKLGPTITKVGNWISTKLTPAFAGLKGLLADVAKWFKELADKMANLKLPAWLTPGSPFPFTYALQGMNKELQKSANAVLPAFSAQLNLGGNAPSLSQSTQQSANTELVSAIRGISRDPIDYEKLARVLRDTVLKEMK